MFRALKELTGTLRALHVTRRRFDYAYYRRISPDLAGYRDVELLQHYHLTGWREGRDPTPDFSTARYLEAYPDVADAGLNPFVHFLTKGEKEGRAPRPARDSDAELNRMRPEFDPAYYRMANPELAHLGDEALLEQFHAAGWREGRDPSARFSVRDYLGENRDVAAAGINPFLHYLTFGRAENREAPRPLPRRAEDLTEAELCRLEEMFDAAFYQNSLGGMAGSPRDLLIHYIDTGWREGHDPGPDFSGAYYRATYGDNDPHCPLVHFVLADYPGARSTAPGLPQHFLRDPEAVTVPHRLMRVLKQPAPEGIAPPATLDPGQGLDLHWVIPDFPQGSGGHMTIFRIIRHLENFGHRATLWIEQPIFHRTAAEAYDGILKYFQCIEADVRFVEDGFFHTSGDAVIATGWTTAYYAEAARGFAAKYYFVQDHETEFYPSGTERHLAERAYGFDLACLCAGPWLEQIMRARYGRWSRSFDLAYDHKVYQPQTGMAEPGGTGPRRHRIAVYAREHTARRCVHLALMGLELLSRERDDFEVHLFGQDEMPFRQAPFHAVNHGVLDDTALAQLYAECDLGLCFSATNYSLVPQEMMACGLPVAELDGPNTRAVFPEDTIALLPPSPEAICAGLAALLDDPEGCAARGQAAAAWVAPRRWERSARMVEAALLDYLRETGAISGAPAVSRPREVVMDVVLPTFNGGAELRQVIDALRRQRLRDNLQIHCIDSSSTDGTTGWLRSQSDIALTVIDQAEFQHGRTRNQAAAAGRAPVIAFLTQDAVPAGPDWATDIAKMMQHFPEAAGLFGRHLPYPQHCLRVRQDITGHFRNMRHHPLALSRETDPVLWKTHDRAWRQFLHFYSDNNSALRRRVWEEIPYPEVDFGEDQLWAKTIIEAGLTKLYAPTAAVWHSHDFSPEEAYARSFTEGSFFFTHFGYELGEGSREELEERLRRAQGDLVGWARQYRVPEEELRRQQDILAGKYHGWRDGRIAAQQGRAGEAG